MAALRCYQNHLDDGDLREIATNCGKEPMPSADDLAQAIVGLNLGHLRVGPQDDLWLTLVSVAAAMRPAGPERRRLLEMLGGPDSDDFDSDGDLLDGDLYRISSDDAELAHWRTIVDMALMQSPWISGRS